MPVEYSVDAVLSVFDTQLGLVLVFGTMIFAGAYIQYLEAIRLGFKHRTHAIPVFANMYFFAHDLVFVALVNHWFVEIGHWLYKLFWVGIIIFTLLECVVHYQTIKYSRQDLLPMLSQRQYIGVYLLMQAGILLLFVFIYSHLKDPLFLISVASTEIISNVWNIPMLLSRRSRKGQSFWLAGGLLLGSNIGFFFLFLPLLADVFASPIYLAAGAAVTILNLIYMWALSKYPAYTVESRSSATESPATTAL